MRAAVMKHLPEASLIVKAAAVADYRPRVQEEQKMKRSGPLTVEFEPTEDILAEVAAKKRTGALVIGFAAETENAIDHGREKLLRKGADAIVMNDVSRVGIGFDSDNNAVTFLTRAHESARGLVQFLKILNQRETIMMGHVDPYVMTHPLTPERIAALQGRVEDSPYYNTPFPAAYQMPYARMKAKLTGFLDPFDETRRRYPSSDHSIPALYARAIAYYRQPDLGKALPLVDGLIAEEPRNPYFQELRGQMLFENGQIEAAIAPYREAVRLAPDSALLRIGLAQALIEIVARRGMRLPPSRGSGEELDPDPVRVLDVRPAARRRRPAPCTPRRRGRRAPSARRP